MPTIVSWPGHIEKGTVCEHNVCHTDFFRTFADILGVELPDEAAEDSYSNLGLWNGTDDCDRNATVYSCSSGYMGVVSGGWKLNLCANGGATPEAMKSAFTKTPIEQKFELYNLNEDISETTDLLDAQPEIVEKLKAEMTKAFENGRSTPGVKRENYVPKSYPWVQINWK